MQNSLCVQVLCSPILAALLHGTRPAAGVSQTLRRATKNGITELSQRAPPIFGWAAITLGIGTHYSLFLCAVNSRVRERLSNEQIQTASLLQECIMVRDGLARLPDVFYGW